MLLPAAVVVVLISLLCLHKDGMGPRMNDPLQPAVHHLRRDMRRLAEQYAIPCSKEYKGWCVAVREKMVFMVGTDDEMLATLS